MAQLSFQMKKEKSDQGWYRKGITMKILKKKEQENY